MKSLESSLESNKSHLAHSTRAFIGGGGSLLNSDSTQNLAIEAPKNSTESHPNPALSNPLKPTNPSAILRKCHIKSLCAILKVFSTLLKNYKRYYFGTPRLKMCYYAMKDDAQKAQKYKQKHKRRYKHICDSKRKLKNALRFYAEFRRLIPQTSYTLHKKGDFIDIADFLDLKQQAINNLCVKIEKQYFYILQKDSLLVRKIKQYLEDLLFAIYEQNELYKKQAIITEQDILTFLRYATNCRKKFKAHLDERMSYLKANHADIVESWKYYKEFEAMCKELDST